MDAFINGLIILPLKGMVKSIYETKRLIIRPWRKRDAIWLKKWGQDPDVALPTGWKPVVSLFLALEMIATGYRKPWAFAIEEKESSKVIGSVSLMPESMGHFKLKKDEMEIGYWIGKPFWGQGFMGEALESIFDDLFANNGIHRIYCICAAKNTQSIRVQEKLGFRYNKTENIWQQGLNKSVLSHVSLLEKEDWRSYRERSAR